MPSNDVNSPVSSAPTGRLALGVGWVRPGAAGIGGTLDPSNAAAFACLGRCSSGSWCFEGNEE